MKSKIYNLIILDESGSMACVWKQTINGCNETINTIRAAQKQFADTQEHYVSIYAFQGGTVPSRYIIKNKPAMEVDHISNKDYRPGGMTPLYDAVGSTLVDLKATVNGEPTSIGNVTIITDGEENASEVYTQQKVANMISALKEIGWSFSFIGANIDVKGTASSLNIDNSLEFEQNEVGTEAMFAKERFSRMSWFGRTSDVLRSTVSEECLSEDQRRSFYEKLKKSAKSYFDDDNEA